MFSKRHLLNRLFLANAAVLIGLVLCVVIFSQSMSNRSLSILIVTLTVPAILIMAAVNRRAIRVLDDQVDQVRDTVDRLVNLKLNNRNLIGDSLPVGRLVNDVPRWQSRLRDRKNGLAQQVEQLRTVLNNLVEGVITLDSAWKIVFANNAANSLLSITVADAVNRQLLEVVRIPEIERIVAAVYETGQTMTAEFETVRGVRRILSLRCSVPQAISVPPDKNEGDGIPDEVLVATESDGQRGVVLVLHDITELRALETMRRDFVTNVSHELKTPLSSIFSNAETLRLGAIDDIENRMGFLQRIEEQALRLNNLIMDLIQLARIESKQQNYDIVDLDAAKASKRRVESFREDAGVKKIDLSLEIGTQPIVVCADEEAFRTILDNLITNAIRYTPDQGEVIVRCEKIGEEAIVSVQDTGLGIALEHRERIFERFYRVDKARSSDLGGTGLGLSIVKHLVQSMKGSVSLESKIGMGSKFVVRLPLK